MACQLFNASSDKNLCQCCCNIVPTRNMFKVENLSSFLSPSHAWICVDCYREYIRLNQDQLVFNFDIACPKFDPDISQNTCFGCWEMFSTSEMSHIDERKRVWLCAECLSKWLVYRGPNIGNVRRNRPGVKTTVNDLFQSFCLLNLEN